MDSLDPRTGLGSSPVLITSPWRSRDYNEGYNSKFNPPFPLARDIQVDPVGSVRASVRVLGSGSGLGFGLGVWVATHFSLPQGEPVCIFSANEALVCPPECSRLGGPPERSEGGAGARMVGRLRAAPMNS